MYVLEKWTEKECQCRLLGYNQDKTVLVNYMLENEPNKTIKYDEVNDEYVIRENGADIIVYRILSVFHIHPTTVE